MAELDRLEALALEKKVCLNYKGARAIQSEGEDEKAEFERIKSELDTRLEAFLGTMRDPMSDLLHQIEEELNRDVFDLVKGFDELLSPVLRGSSEYETILNTLSTNISRYIDQRSIYVCRQQAFLRKDEGAQEPQESTISGADLKGFFEAAQRAVYDLTKAKVLEKAVADGVEYKAAQEATRVRLAEETEAARLRAAAEAAVAAEAARVAAEVRQAAELAAVEDRRVAAEAHRRTEAEAGLKSNVDGRLVAAINAFVVHEVLDCDNKGVGRTQNPDVLLSVEQAEAEDSFLTAICALVSNRTGQNLSGRQMPAMQSNSDLQSAIKTAIKTLQGLSGLEDKDPKQAAYKVELDLKIADAIRVYREVLMQRVHQAFEDLTDPAVQTALTKVTVDSVRDNENNNPLPVGSPLVEVVDRLLRAHLAAAHSSEASVSEVLDEAEIVQKIMAELAPKLTEFGNVVGRRAASEAGTAAAAATPTAEAIADAMNRRQPKVKQPGFFGRLPGRLALLGTGAALGAGAMQLSDGSISDWLSRDEAVDAPTDGEKEKGATEAQQGGEEKAAKEQEPTFTAWTKLPATTTAANWTESLGGPADSSKLLICCAGGELVKGEGTICTKNNVVNNVPSDVNISWTVDGKIKMWDIVGEKPKGFQAFPEGESVKEVCAEAKSGNYGSVLVRD